MSSSAVSTGIRLRNILLATDFSSCSDTALLCATALARRFESTLCTTTVIRADATDCYIDSPDQFYFRSSAESKMAKLACREAFQGVKHREVVVEGFIAETVLRLIHELEIDLVVLGCHGRDGIKKVVRGSVSEVIVQSVPCPVLTVGPLVKPNAQFQLRKIIFATDLLHASTNALSCTLWLAEQEHARLTLLHVLKTASASEIESAVERLAHLLPPNGNPGGTEFIVETGTPAEHILKVAEDQGADLIVMNPHHTAHARLSTHLLGVTPYQVLCHAKCPVLTVRD
jgi:nucleotide-binding universal stress UspA family protein